MSVFLVLALVSQLVFLCSVLRRFVHATGCGKHLFVICIPHGVFFLKIIFIIIIIINSKDAIRAVQQNFSEQATPFTYTRIHPHIHLRQRTIPSHITQLSSAGMTDRLTTNPRHRNERLTVLLAASNKRRHSCPGHRCFENSSLISWA